MTASVAHALCDGLCAQRSQSRERMVCAGRNAFTRLTAIPLGVSLAAETGRYPGEESRLKAGCSQDWLPHKVLQGVPTLYDSKAFVIDWRIAASGASA
jgi:hypothetical protein